MEETLEQFMSHCTGSENFYRFPLIPNCVYTDGVNAFVEKAKAWWFVSDSLLEIVRLCKKHPEVLDFCSVKLTVKDEKALVEFTDGDNNPLKTKKYTYTDCPSCELVFYFIGGTFMYCGEY